MRHDEFQAQHLAVTRRFFLQFLGGTVVSALLPRPTGAETLPEDCAKACRAFLDAMEYLTAQEDFGNVSRGNPRPYDLTDAQKQDAGLTPDTWALDVVSDPDNPADLEREYSNAAGNAIDWDLLMALSEKHAVSFAKVITCLNMGKPLGMGIWEGVPLREIIWMAGPRGDVRRVFYSGFHNNDPEQLFRSSLPAGRVLEDPFDLPPVILCYKLNGRLLTGERGGPVRMVVPESYGFKSVKWLNRIVLSNIPNANDTYADGNNDIDSAMKTFARSMLKPETIRAGAPIPVTGYAQVGISGLKRVQTLLLPHDAHWSADDPNFTTANWTDAHILPPPDTWNGYAPDGRLPRNLHQFEAEAGKPLHWPLRLTMAHWATLLPGQPTGKYILRCRSIDEKNIAQPMPRPFKKSGRNAIEEVEISIA